MSSGEEPTRITPSSSDQKKESEKPATVTPPNLTGAYNMNPVMIV